MTRSGPRSERGSSTIWAVALFAVILTAALLGLAVAQAALARQRATTAADLAALAAASTWIGQCERARAIAELNHAALLSCEVTSAGASVQVLVPAPQLVSRLVSWAGRTPQPYLGQARAG